MADSEYDSWFDNIFAEMTRGIEDHQFKHHNYAMGIDITCKEHYKIEMKRRRMVPYDIAHKLADKWDSDHPRDNYDELSPKAIEIIKSLKMGADSEGNIIIGQKGIEALKEIGWMPGKHEHAPDRIEMTGGFKD